MWIGDAAQIAAMRVRKQKTDPQDAQFLLKLMLEDASIFADHQVNQAPSTSDLAVQCQPDAFKLSKFLSDANFVVHADCINARGAGTVGRGHAQPQPIGGHWLDPVYAAPKVIAGFCRHRFPSAFHIDR